jgi:hypothetical protein
MYFATTFADIAVNSVTFNELSISYDFNKNCKSENGSIHLICENGWYGGGSGSGGK